MFSSRILRATAPKIAQQARPLHGIAKTLQENVWKKSTVSYITYIVAGCVVLEVVYGKVTNYVWESYNYGKLYHQVDWSKFKNADEDDE
mmetsp:Transcript_30578/g.33400  ORF Transcript_30578/g.33400 Transcript_30578/m.33400 type:complete len:89 (-) Transcript_30578:84-350(-)|eukprot:gene7165-7737_t